MRTVRSVGGSVIVGALAQPGEGPLSLAHYQTVRLHEFHELGPDGQPTRHRTVQTIRALVDDLATHRYFFDLAETRVELIHGGAAGDPYRVNGSLWAVDLALPRPLRKGEEHTVEYISSFRYDGPIPPNFRRAAHRRIENISMRVTFHPEMVPQEAWWAEWEDYREPNDRIVRQIPVALEDGNTLEHHVSVMERAVAGFVWKFD